MNFRLRYQKNGILSWNPHHSSKLSHRCGVACGTYASGDSLGQLTLKVLQGVKFDELAGIFARGIDFREPKNFADFLGENGWIAGLASPT